MQEIVLDVTGKPFQEFMAAAVLQPLGMTNSTYEQPLPKALTSKTATGYFASGKPVPGRWHVYREMALAGLWTTASDLAQFAIGLQQSLAGKSNPAISASMTRQMLTEKRDGDGLGVFLKGTGKALRFSHGGRDAVFDATVVADAETGQGTAVMINCNDDSGALGRVVEAIAHDYH
jgi:CubicO group peptidase (beta-lactamase class C family)